MLNPLLSHRLLSSGKGLAARFRGTAGAGIARVLPSTAGRFRGPSISDGRLGEIPLACNVPGSSAIGFLHGVSKLDAGVCKMQRLHWDLGIASGVGVVRDAADQYALQLNLHVPERRRTLMH